jgi:8-oxo-dGTP pyrophosphatase MutT (NUDIX family)
MNESVIYVLRSESCVLCEWRDFNGTTQNCALGGSIDTCDRLHENYVFAAAIREAKEELGISTEQCQLLGEFVSDDGKFHVVLICSWGGTIPAANRDNQNELRWVSVDTFLSSITIDPMKRIIEKLADANPMVETGPHIRLAKNEAG